MRKNRPQTEGWVLRGIRRSRGKGSPWGVLSKWQFLEGNDDLRAWLGPAGVPEQKKPK
ncbi:hypothetical protein K0M31_018178, partial [Melipona bicolor]